MGADGLWRMHHPSYPDDAQDLRDGPRAPLLREAASLYFFMGPGPVLIAAEGSMPRWPLMAGFGRLWRIRVRDPDIKWPLLAKMADTQAHCLPGTLRAAIVTTQSRPA